jgi:glycosyltransferase involved in cell wall biosynthesis
LAEAMGRFIDDPSLIETMGARARARAEEKYDVHRVNDVILSTMGL